MHGLGGWRLRGAGKEAALGGRRGVSLLSNHSTSPRTVSHSMRRSGVWNYAAVVAGRRRRSECGGVKRRGGEGRGVEAETE